jgi:hydroxymethylpyrimidine kinase/phosphomethylpyrimidine kinase
MLPTAEIIHGVADIIRAHPVAFVVVDPVLRSTSGFRLVDDPAVDSLKGELFPLASVVTPNVEEARRLVGVDINEQCQVESAAEAILKTQVSAVLITGGDTVSSLATDLLLDSLGSTEFSTERIDPNTLTALAPWLQRSRVCWFEEDLCANRLQSRKSTLQAIATAPAVGGHGPLNHFPSGFRFEG